MKIGRYEILDEVGQGAMGTVYRARDPLIERAVAIKTLPIAQLRSEGTDVESRFLREAQSAGRLSHPNIVTIYDVGEVDDIAYIAMEYLAGATLRDIMDRGPMPLDLALETATQMAEALAFAHEHGVIHRDVKPANVVISGPHGRVKLTDFGIAHFVNSNQTQTGQMLGSPRYMSPEQAMGRDIDGRSDIFSLGAVFYEMLTGQYAFDGNSLPAILYRVINETPVSAASLRPSLPVELSTLLTRLLSKQPEERPDARALAAALHAMVSGSTAPQPITPPSNNQASSRLLRTVAFATPVGVLLLIGLGIIVIEHFLPKPLPETSPLAPSEEATQTTPAPPASDSEADSSPPAAASRANPLPNTKQIGIPSAAKPDPYLVGLEKKRVELRLKRTELLLQYTKQHPDVVQVDNQLEQLRIERKNYLRQRGKE